MEIITRFLQSLLKQQLAEAEAQREKMLSDHGKIAAEMQQSYAKERVYSEQLGKQVKNFIARNLRIPIFFVLVNLGFIN